MSNKRTKLKQVPKTSKKLAVDREPYERQPWETDPAWDGFVLYRDMAERTVRKVAEQRMKDRGISPEKFQAEYNVALDWSAHGAWRARVEAWDLEKDRALRKEQLSNIKKMQVRHARLGQGMQQLGGLGLSTLLEKANAAGKKITISPTDIKNLIALGVQIERESVGEPGAIVEERHTIEAGDVREGMRSLLRDKDALDAAKKLVAKVRVNKS